MSFSPPSPSLNKFLKGKTKWGIFSTKTAEEYYKLQLNENDTNKILYSLKQSLEEKNRLITNLEIQLSTLSSSSFHSQYKNNDSLLNSTNSPNSPTSPALIIPRKHQFNLDTYLISDEGSERSPIATRGSVLTTNYLHALGEQPLNSISLLAQKFIEMFKKPIENVNYLKSSIFANDLIEICYSICDILENEPRCLFMQSPIYVIGDIHGNLEDLHFFTDNLFPLGMELAAAKFLFLGDYVDRGMNCLECVAYLFALKVLSPGKVFLLRFVLSLFVCLFVLLSTYSTLCLFD